MNDNKLSKKAQDCFDKSDKNHKILMIILDYLIRAEASKKGDEKMGQNVKGTLEGAKGHGRNGRWGTAKYGGARAN